MFDRFFRNPAKLQVPSADEALPGRDTPIPVVQTHAVLDSPLQAPFPEGTQLAMFGMGCFWGAERKFWTLPGVVSTAVGYAAGHTHNPHYKEVCSGRTGHNEVVRVAYDPSRVDYRTLLKTFWENHDPTQGMRQGNDVGTQYRSGIYCYDDTQRELAEGMKATYGDALAAAGRGQITTEIIDAPAFYFAEDYHQQYLHKNPGGYCNHGFNGVSCPIGTGVEADRRH